MWFFPRASIPSDLTASGSVDPSTWGTPTAAYPVSSCALSNFAPQQMIITTTLCGQWAGAFGRSLGRSDPTRSAVGVQPDLRLGHRQRVVLLP